MLLQYPFDVYTKQLRLIPIMAYFEKGPNALHFVRWSANTSSLFNVQAISTQVLRTLPSLRRALHPGETVIISIFSMQNRPHQSVVSSTLLNPNSWMPASSQPFPSSLVRTLLEKDEFMQQQVFEWFCCCKLIWAMKWEDEIGQHKAASIDAEHEPR